MYQLTMGNIIVFIIILIIVVLITQAIWNHTLPEIFGCKQINFWQTLGLLVLSSIFFGGQCGAVATVCTS